MTWRSIPSPGMNHWRAISCGMVGGQAVQSVWWGTQTQTQEGRDNSEQGLAEVEALRSPNKAPSAARTTVVTQSNGSGSGSGSGSVLGRQRACNILVSSRLVWSGLRSCKFHVRAIRSVADGRQQSRAEQSTTAQRRGGQSRGGGGEGEGDVDGWGRQTERLNCEV
jgi:hypothetical protein